jgi:hypothetical protein
MDTVSKENLGEGSATSFKYMIYGSPVNGNVRISRSHVPCH